MSEERETRHCLNPLKPFQWGILHLAASLVVNASSLGGSEEGTGFMLLSRAMEKMNLTICELEITECFCCRSEIKHAGPTDPVTWAKPSNRILVVLPKSSADLIHQNTNGK